MWACVSKIHVVIGSFVELALFVVIRGQFCGVGSLFFCGFSGWNSCQAFIAGYVPAGPSPQPCKQSLSSKP